MMRLLISLVLSAQVGALGWLVYRDWDHGRIQAVHQAKIGALEQSLDRATVTIKQQSSVLDRTIGKVIPVMPDRVADLEQSLERAVTEIEQQSTALDKTIGEVVSVIPARISTLEHSLDQAVSTIKKQRQNLQDISDLVFPPMPAGCLDSLVELERVVANEDKWPKTGQAAQDYLGSISDLISELPSWAESEYMARLNVVRWSAMVFTTINPPENREVDLHARAETLAALSESAPNGTGNKLIERVDREQARLVRAADAADWKSLRQRAEGYVAKPGSVTSGIIQQDIALLLAHLDSADPSRRNDAGQLLRDLQKIMFRLEAEQQVQSLRSRLESLMQLKDEDPALFEAGVGMLLEEVRSARMNLALSGLDVEALNQVDSQLKARLEQLQNTTRDGQEVAHARAVRAYQKYALESIERFSKRFQDRDKIAEEALRRIRTASRYADDYRDLPSVQHAIKNAKYRKIERPYLPDDEEYKLYGINESLESHLTHRVCRDAMVTHLLPIDLRLLEMPVQDLFQQAWQSGWKYLDGRADRTKVAERTIDVSKTTLSDVQGGQE